MSYVLSPKYNSNGIRIQTDAESQWVLEAIQCVDGDASIMDPVGDRECLEIQIRKIGEEYEIELENIETVRTPHPVFMTLALIKKYARLSAEYFSLHAAALEIYDQVYTFTAATGTGKTSLAAFLASSGGMLYGDDLTVIHRKSLEVLPTYKPIMLRKPSLFLLEKYGIYLESQRISDGEYDRYMHRPLHMAGIEKPLKGIFVIHIDPEQRIQRIEDERTRMQRIMMNAMEPETFSIPYFQFLQRMSQLPMYEVWYEDFNWFRNELEKISFFGFKDGC